MKPLYLIFIFPLLFSCSVQKRKYVPGYHVEWNHQQHKVEEKQASGDNTGQEETIPVYTGYALTADNSISITAENFTPAPLPLTNTSCDSCDVIITKRGDTLYCQIIRETSIRIYYRKVPDPAQQDSLANHAERNILRDDVKSYTWKSKAKLEKQMQVKGKKSNVVIKPAEDTTVAKNKSADNVLAGTSIDFGLISILLTLIALFTLNYMLFLVACIPGIIGLLLGGIALDKSKRELDPAGKKKALLGILLSSSPLIALILIFVLAVLFFRIA